MPSYSITSVLDLPVDEFLETLTMQGVNSELKPLVRMTAPAAFSGKSIFEWPVRQKLFRSWILLFGILPIDRHSFYFETINSGEGFAEHSTSWTNEYWSHERRIAAHSSGCRVTDTVSFKSRIPFVDKVLEPAYRLVFWLRHRNLRARYGGKAD